VVEADLPGGLGAPVGRIPQGGAAVALACRSSLTMLAQARRFSSRVLAMPDLYLIKQVDQGRENLAAERAGA